MRPDSAIETLRPDLGGSLEEWDLLAEREGFIATQVLPVIDAETQSGPFGRIPLEELLQKASTRRTGKGAYNRMHFNFETDSYATEEHGIEVPVDERDAAIYANYFDAEMIAANLALSTVLRAQEERVADEVFDTTVWTGSSLTTSSSDWSDEASGTPIADVRGAIHKVRDGTGMMPNAIILNWEDFDNGRNCDEVIDRLKYQGFQDVRPEVISAQAFAMALGIPRVIVAGAMNNTADKGQSASLSNIWDAGKAMVARLAETPSIKEPCLGRTIHWSADGSQIGGTVESYYEAAVRADVVRVRHDVQEKILYKEMGHLLTDLQGT